MAISCETQGKEMKGIKKMADIEARIPVLFFEEANKVIAYSPAFDLSSCGDTEEQARKRFTEAVAIFLHEITTMGTLSEVLEECGWYKVPEKHGWSPPVYRTCTEESVRIPIRG
jgi:hypothetical protein